MTEIEGNHLWQQLWPLRQVPTQHLGFSSRHLFPSEDLILISGLFTSKSMMNCSSRLNFTFIVKDCRNYVILCSPYHSCVPVSPCLGYFPGVETGTGCQDNLPHLWVYRTRTFKGCLSTYSWSCCFLTEMWFQVSTCHVERSVFPPASNTADNIIHSPRTLYTRLIFSILSIFFGVFWSKFTISYLTEIKLTLKIPASIIYLFTSMKRIY